ncbi:hypothetical protein [Patulibacter defluvii]|uniref:hypothetical protein n=1 Tax=Patulibacter defluvii TaxID=3095358 RepID=UPI002A759673|nr:hypothetical protein [Patulibacter sp. DM4]
MTVPRPDDPAAAEPAERAAAPARPAGGSSGRTVSDGIVPGPPRTMVPDALRADRGGGAVVDLPADLEARLDRARTRLVTRRARELAVPAVEDAATGDDGDGAPATAPRGDGPDPAELAARLDAARQRLDAPRRRRGGLGRD